jgi:hypothetical protein
MDVMPPFTKQWLDTQVNENQATRLLNDLDLYLEEIHSEFVKSQDGHLLWSYALKGALSFGHGSTSPR